METQPDLKSGGAREILVVEDKLPLRERIYDALTRHGCVVIAVHSAERALAVLKNARPSLLIGDTTLTDAAGWELADRVRAFDGALPIILLHDAGSPADGTTTEHKVQALLSCDVDEAALWKEVERWAHGPMRPRRERWPGTVLIVDDERKLRDLLQAFLEDHGFTVATAVSGEEAIGQCRRIHPSVVLLDIKMPGMDGLLTLKKIKDFNASTTVIMLTGLEDEQVMSEALALGAYDYLLKPFNLEYLETVLVGRMLLGKAP